MRSSRILLWENMENILSRGMKAFSFYVLLFALLRGWFIFRMQDYMGDAAWEEVLTACWRGLRLSCQTAGILTLPALVSAVLFRCLRKPLEQVIWDVVTGLELVAISILYIASFPFYRQFHSNYNQIVFNTFNDDSIALFWSMVQEFYLPVRLAAALALAFLLWQGLRHFLRWDMGRLLSFFWIPDWLRWGGRLVFLGCCCLVVLWGIFGGSLGWRTAVDWENAGVTKNRFLNEMILDSFQALWRGYQLQNRMLACNGLNFTAEDIRLLAAKLAHRAPDADNLDEYLLRFAQGAQMEKPRHIFLILSESYANWPLLEEYSGLRIADGMKEVIQSEDSAYVRTFLPNGASTVSAVTGVVTGFADANLYLTTMPEAFQAPYPTAAAPQMERLGYETYFWYAGPATWERIGDFTRAQGFDHFYSRGDFGNVPGSVWGCEDRYLYEKVLKEVPAETAGFHVILSASNHSPYTVDLKEEGFPAEYVREALPQAVKDDEELLTELGHYWYADKELFRFVNDAKKKFPDSIFIIVGDHADRYNIEKTPAAYVRYGIPFILTGKGVHQELLLPDAAGSQIDIVPTIVELIAPEGFPYYALGASLSRTNRQGVNYGFWIRSDAIGDANAVPLVPEALEGGEPPVIDDQAMQDYINAIRGISWWRAKYGPVLDEGKLVE